MGVYLSAPILEKESSNQECPDQGFCIGTSSMQGWRVTQEDAHNTIPVFDEKSKTSFFAVYDGHGGSEVAKYCELHFPNFVKELMEAKTDWDTNPTQFIQSAFLAFDATLTSDDIIKELKTLSGKEDDNEDDDEESLVGRAETDLLKEEAEMPLEELLAQYKKTPTANGSTPTASPSISSSKAATTDAGDTNNCASTAADSTTPTGPEAAGSSVAQCGSGSGSSSKPSNGERSSKVKAAADMAKLSADPDSDEEEEDMWEDMSDDDDDDEDDDDEEANDQDGTPIMDTSDEEPGADSGCTACVLLKQGSCLLVANAGDSRCVLARAGKAIDLSYDHKPEDAPERKRIEKAGGKVTLDGRVNGGLNLSRAIGDHVYKRNTDVSAREQMISALPDVMTEQLTREDQFLVLACDGIWNSMTSQEVVDFVAEKLKDPEKRKRPATVCEELFDLCLAPNTHGDGTGCDNMTCIIIVLDGSKCEEGERESKTDDGAKVTQHSTLNSVETKKKSGHVGDEGKEDDGVVGKEETVDSGVVVASDSKCIKDSDKVASVKEDEGSTRTKRCADDSKTSEEKRRKVEENVA